MLTTSAKAADEVPSTRSALVSRRSWALCFAKEPMEEGSGIEYEQRCNAFRSRQGPIGLGIATVHEVVLRQIRHNDEGIINEGDDRSEHIRITYMEETMQIFHPDEVRDRVDFIAHATADLLDELSVDTTETATLSWSIEAAAVKFPRLLALKSSHRALRGMSLLSYEVIPTSVFARSGKQLQRASLGRPQSSLTSMCDAEAASRLPDVCGQDHHAGRGHQTRQCCKALHAGDRHHHLLKRNA
ncbi:Hypothetical protein, putative [Bodo saltans]|uniref:Uncharacterized protein n=1 Tax=Bodo saltans TaxID=75058 RepID=A0A0S4JD20_BODSA|nr:Hypothetical protein, putative [Bodo saltans]|eukprot:CUG86842.1 Hypothetical protein, putative [Bodo saltans]